MLGNILKKILNFLCKQMVLLIYVPNFFGLYENMLGVLKTENVQYIEYQCYWVQYASNALQKNS